VEYRFTMSRSPSSFWKSQKNGQLTINSQPVVATNLETTLRVVFASRAAKTLFLKADRDVEYRSVAHAIDVARSADPGIEVGFLTPGLAR
jgi:biopolymer transport protein ExbD